MEGKQARYGVVPDYFQVLQGEYTLQWWVLPRYLGNFRLLVVTVPCSVSILSWPIASGYMDVPGKSNNQGLLRS